MSAHTPTVSWGQNVSALAAKVQSCVCVHQVGQGMLNILCNSVGT